MTKSESWTAQELKDRQVPIDAIVKAAQAHVDQLRREFGRNKKGPDAKATKEDLAKLVSPAYVRKIVENAFTPLVQADIVKDAKADTIDFVMASLVL